MTSILMIGISGLDADLLRVYGPSLPNIRHLMLESPFLELRSSFPPRPACAWTSVYTGLNPASHGIIGTGCAGEQEDSSQEPLAERKICDGETFWNIARRAGKQVCIVNPLLPASSSTRDIHEGSDGLNLSPLSSETFPPLLNSSMISLLRKPGDFCSLLHERSAQQAAIGLRSFNREPWDLFFLQFDALDHVQHTLWRYSDPGDPGYPGRNRFAHLIADFYRLFDRIIGSFRAAMHQDCVLMVVSSYGFGRRCAHRLQLNEWLRSRNLLRPAAMSLPLFARRYFAERMNIRPAELLAHLQLWDVLPDSLRSPAGNRNADSHAYSINEQETVAQLVDFAGVSPFGGIRLNQACIERRRLSYAQVRESLLADLAHLRVKDQLVVRWAKAREDVYTGKYMQRFPDILFELRSDFGVDSRLYVPPVTQDPLHRIISGGRTMSGVLLLGNLTESMYIHDGIREPSVEDVAPIILSILDVASVNSDGKALVKHSPVKAI
jgi:predicted AlkP superfamily phosphohydrolase/phosphomutase